MLFNAASLPRTPRSNFAPDYGKILAYRSAAGFGVRLDGGSAYGGAIITPFYDSLLVKVTAWARDFDQACARLDRALREFRIRGVKTNIPFLENVSTTPTSRRGVTTTFLIDTPELFDFLAAPRPRHQAAHLSGRHHRERQPRSRRVKPPQRVSAAPGHRPRCQRPPAGTRQLLQQLGPKGFAEWTRQQERLLITDTTLRDAQQSLLATRVRTYDMLAIAGSVARRAPSSRLEMWGGATFDVAMRFVREDPWERLRLLREQCPTSASKCSFAAPTPSVIRIIPTT